MEKKLYPYIPAILTASAAILLFFCFGCEKHTPPPSPSLSDTASAQPEENLFAIDMQVSAIEKKETASLPDASPLLSDSPVGMNPVYSYYGDGLTYFVADSFTDEVYQCTLPLPQACSGGKIFYLTDGAGSGEMFLYVQTSLDDSSMYLVYYLVGDTLLSVDVLDNGQLHELKQAMNKHYLPIYMYDDVYVTEDTPVQGSGFLSIPAALTGYTVADCALVRCTELCDPAVIVSLTFYGYAPVFPIHRVQEYRTEDGWNYPTVQLCTDTSVPMELSAELLAKEKRRYLYLLTLEEEYYAVICLLPENPDDWETIPADEQEKVDDIIRNVTYRSSALQP